MSARIDYGLQGRVALVTGGSRGIGLEIARMLLDQGASVAICGRKQPGLDQAVEQLGGGDRLLAVPAHVAKADQVQALFEATVQRFGRLDILVNNVGMNLATGLADADPAVFAKIVDTNLNGTFLCCRQAAGIMKQAGGGKIVNISSIAAHRAAPLMGIYGVAKAGIEMMTRVLAQELAPSNIQVNAVAPCMVKTGFSQPFWQDENLHKAIVASIPAGRIATVQDVAHPVLFLCSDGAGFITGQTLMVDGGASAV